MAKAHSSALMPWDSFSVAMDLPWNPGLVRDDPMIDWEAARDARLVRAARKKPDDFAAIVETHQHRVYATTRRLLKSDADAWDASQEAFLRAYRALPRFKEGKRLAPWLCTIALNVARDMLRDPVRRFVRTTSVAEPISESQADESMDYREMSRELEQALTQLKPRLREAIVLRYVGGMSMEEVAEALCIGTSAAKMRVKRGLLYLRESLTAG